MSVGGQTNNIQPSYLAGQPLSQMTLSLVGDNTNNIQPSYLSGQPLNQLNDLQAEGTCLAEYSFVLHDPLLTHFSLANHISMIAQSQTNCTKETTDAAINSTYYTSYPLSTTFRIMSTSNYNDLSGGMYSGSTDTGTFPWDILKNKLALIGRLPFNCASSSGDCFFASIAHSLYTNAELHFEIRTAGITHMMNNPELYV